MQSRPVIWAAEPLAHAVGERLATVNGDKYRGKVVSSAHEFLKEMSRTGAVAFIDAGSLELIAEQIQHVPSPSTVIAIAEGSLRDGVSWLLEYPWLSHVVSAPMVKHPMGVEHLDHVLSALTRARPKLLSWIDPDVAGRRVLLTHASRRAERLEKMTEFFESKGVAPRTIELLVDVGEELLTNAFYDAPVAAGVVKKAISRESDVTLPDDAACDLVYGCSDNLALVRVRDPFGALPRARVIEVLRRCTRTDMQVDVDETMGGAGLGLWKIISVASFVAISVVADQHTEVLVGIAKRTPGAKRPFALHLFFSRGKRRFWELFRDDSTVAIAKK